ncbi:MerR family transcriptional regulator [Microbacterium gorillae]|uniref:MerR family transcriptional regulator n=1 Tax=Microbacterium gorillae TaxID=1231063 RepID=UPI003D978559
MYTIGEFAALGHVSVRMLRHYDAIGLLRPAEVDPFSGYRRYEPAQLEDLLRVVELRDLGCSLDDAAAVLGADDARAALIAVLARRRSELHTAIDQERARLARVEQRLSGLERNHPMPEVDTPAIEYRRIEEVTVYAASGVAPGGEDVSALVDRLLPPLHDALQSSGVEYHEPGVFWYENVAGTDDLRVWVSWIAGPVPQTDPAWEVITLPAIERAAVLPYRGDMAGIGRAWNELTSAILADGEEPVGGCREVYLESEPLPQPEWLTELIQQVR